MLESLIPENIIFDYTEPASEISNPFANVQPNAQNLRPVNPVDDLNQSDTDWMRMRPVETTVLEPEDIPFILSAGLLTAGIATSAGVIAYANKKDIEERKKLLLNKTS